MVSSKNIIFARAEYAELHCHSWFSFKEGVSSTDDLVTTALNLEYRALALTDHDSLAGAMEFAQISKTLGLKSIIGSELTLQGEEHITVLASDRQGYSNLCKLLSFSHVLAEERSEPLLDKSYLQEYSEGLILLSGCSKGLVGSLVSQNKLKEAEDTALEFKECFGDRYYIELQQNMVKGDTKRNRHLVELAKKLKLEIVATNNVHYHHQSYSNLQDAMVAIKANKSLEEAQHLLRENNEFYLKSPQQMVNIFGELPKAISNTLSISEKCSFDLASGLGYKLPDYSTPKGHTPLTYLWELCMRAGLRRYGNLPDSVEERLKEEFRLIEKHNLAGFLLIYHEIVGMAKEIMDRLGLSDPEIPIEERPPGKGRGSSVALLVGYLLGLSHIDPIRYNLSLERFLPEDRMDLALDIDLDFPRNIREELILEVHKRWGWERASLVAMRSTYQINGAVRDLGKALSIPPNQIDSITKLLDHSSIKDLEYSIKELPEFRANLKNHSWKELIKLVHQIDGAPKYLAQHPGGMVISSSPLTDFVPIQRAGIHGRYMIQWDKNDIEDAGFVKIDILALGSLSQSQDILKMIEVRTGKYPDLSRIDFEDMNVYKMLWEADTIGIFQVESAAQMQIISRLKPRNLVDMAHQVACVRPGVGANDGVRTYLRRRTKQEEVTFDHDLEKKALGRTYGAVIFQDQINELAMCVGGFSPDEADKLRRSFTRKNNHAVLDSYRKQFLEGARSRGVDINQAEKIFRKINGHYMFPESHAYAFGVTAYQMSWLKHYYPLEFYVALMNQQPMGFWGLDTIKEDAKRHGISFLNPHINLSQDKYVIEKKCIRMGLLSVRNIGPSTGNTILEERNLGGGFGSLYEFTTRTKICREEIESLVMSGAFDVFGEDRRTLMWIIGLCYRPIGRQLPLDLPFYQDMIDLLPLDGFEKMILEYKNMNIFPSGHVVEQFRPYLPLGIIDIKSAKECVDGERVKIAGTVARPLQRPLSTAYFMTLADEHGLIALIIWPHVYAKLKRVLKEPLIIVEGVISRKDHTLSLVLTHATVLGSAVVKNRLSEQSNRFLRQSRPMFR
jgi:error-prone DNA polymerase